MWWLSNLCTEEVSISQMDAVTCALPWMLIMCRSTPAREWGQQSLLYSLCMSGGFACWMVDRSGTRGREATMGGHDVCRYYVSVRTTG